MEFGLQQYKLAQWQTNWSKLALKMFTCFLNKLKSDSAEAAADSLRRLKQTYDCVVLGAWECFPSHVVFMDQIMKTVVDEIVFRRNLSLKESYDSK